LVEAMIVLSHFQLSELTPPAFPIDISISIDLGQTMVQAHLDKDGINFPGGCQLGWDPIQRIQLDQNGCFLVDETGIHRIKYFSEKSNRTYNLFPTPSAPTMLISGIPMHRIKETDPWQDTLEKIKSFGGIHGTLLDTNTGLGYTAIASAQTASWVMSIEIEAAVLKLCQQNPWSKPLFHNPRISCMLGDSFEIITTLPDRSFDNILHDPPTFSLAGDLYSLDFYAQLWRVLAAKGKLFHYIGNPNSKTGANLTRSVIQRLTSAGFTQIITKPEAFGLLALKG
jgi:predicted methyltransferase